MASAVGWVGGQGVQGMLPKGVTFALGLQKERLYGAVGSRWDGREQHMQMPSTMWPAWSGELRRTGGAQVRRDFCASGRIDWALS